MSLVRDPYADVREQTSDAAPQGVPGKRARTEDVQRRQGSAAAPPDLKHTPPSTGDDPFAVHLLGEQGVAGASSAMPHGDAIQRSFGRHDISAVQAHTDAAASRAATGMGAEAYATGNHVAFAAAPSLHTAAHEAAHVVQQRGGVQLKSGVGEQGDSYERHADEVADAVVAGRSAESLLDRHAPSAGNAASAAPGGVQMYIAIGLEKPRYVKTVDEAVAGIRQAAAGNGDPSHILGGLDEREAQVRTTLAEWINSSGELWTNVKEYSKSLVGAEMSEQPAQWRKYRDFYELGVAVVYETHPQTVKNKQREGALAAYVAGDPLVNQNLNLVKGKIFKTLNDTVDQKLLAAFKDELDGTAMSMGYFRGSYRQIGSYKDEGGMKLDALNFLNVLSASFETNIAVIHDMMEHLSGKGGGGKFSTSLSGTLADPRDEAYETTLLENPPAPGATADLEQPPADATVTRTTRRNEKGDIDKKNMKGRTNVGTRDVKDIDTITAMVMNAPMLAGKSMTTARMMELVNWAGGSSDDCMYVAWAIFAYWKHHYPASTVPFHTFHEVMDIAKNYGVPYKPFFYPDLSTGNLVYSLPGTVPFNDNAEASAK